MVLMLKKMLNALKRSYCVCRTVAVLSRNSSSKVPDKHTWEPVSESDLPKPTKIEDATIDHLERLALVDFANQAGIHRIESAIRFADQLFLVDTTGVEPMDSILENSSVYLREDAITDGNCRDEVMKTAKKTEEEYYVAPPGNIPLCQKERQYGESDS